MRTGSTAANSSLQSRTLVSLTRLATLCHERGIRQIFTRPYTPKTNGKAVSFIQTLTQRWAYKRP